MVRADGPAMDNLPVLSSWIEGCLADPAPFPRRALPAWLSELGQRHGFFRDCGLASTIDCPSCDETHVCPVRRNGSTEFEFYCDRRRWRPIGRAAVELVQFSRPHLISAIATTAGCSWSPHQDAGDSVIRLGELNTASGRRTWTLAYADGLEGPDRLAGMIQTLKRMNPGGLVITPSRMPLHLPLPKKYVIAPLHAVLRIGNHTLTFDASAAFDLLGEHADSPDEPGRKTLIEIEKDLWIQHHRDADWPGDSFTAQADFILNRWPKGNDAPVPNKRYTIAGHISANNQKWAAEANSKSGPKDR